MSPGDEKPQSSRITHHGSRITFYVLRFTQEAHVTVNIVQEIDAWVKVRRALVSVADKSRLDFLIPNLVEVNPEVHFYSTGGTCRTIAQILGPERAAAHLTAVADYTGQPETQGGLVKTLDFKIYLGLLTETYNESHQADLARTNGVPFDMVVSNLYPFEATVAREGATVEEARANIDIGGPCMIRAAAKNYLRVAPVVDPADYAPLVAFLRAHGGRLNLPKRFELARKAFAHTARYDAAISEYLAGQDSRAVENVYVMRNA
jgi:phosphoribosylaminoimidazolecarboxamide formyltransferase/IMP cyclohydrolase